MGPHPLPGEAGRRAAGGDARPRWSPPGSSQGYLPARRLADDGLAAWEEVLERGYEGLAAKDPASPYVGGRTNADSGPGWCRNADSGHAARELHSVTH